MIDWVESGGPIVNKPKRRGQGTRFIERSIGHELQGKVDVTFDQDGLRARLTFPLASATVPADGSSLPSGANN